MKIILKNAKLYGFDPTIFKTFENNGIETKQYNAILHITDEDKEVIDSFLFGKVSVNGDGENVFYGKSKFPIPVFDKEKNKITTAINKVFLANVSILIDEFTPKDQSDPIRYSKCLGIQYLEDIEGVEAKLPAKQPETFEEIFAKTPDMFDAIKKTEAVTPSAPETFEPTIPPIDDLPF